MRLGKTIEPKLFTLAMEIKTFTSKYIHVHTNVANTTREDIHKLALCSPKILFEGHYLIDIMNDFCEKKGYTFMITVMNSTKPKEFNATVILKKMNQPQVVNKISKTFVHSSKAENCNNVGLLVKDFLYSLLEK
jgi:hypothetical protein